MWRCWVPSQGARGEGNDLNLGNGYGASVGCHCTIPEGRVTNVGGPSLVYIFLRYI